MHYQTVALAIIGAVTVVEAGHYHRGSWGLTRRQNRNGGGGGGGGNGQNNGGNGGNGQNNGGNNGGGNCLAQNAIQSASNQVGDLSDPTRAPSDTDANNFINFCSGKTITNGLQIEGGSCNGIVMGDIPAKNRMPSVLITNPPNGGNVAANTQFEVTVKVRNFQPGTFTNPDETYYSAPQKLNGGGQIIGHTHVTCQDVGNAGQIPPAETFAFFKGINDAGDGQGNLKAVVTDGLPAGNFRCCTMTSGANHQPAVMPVAQRGSMDDCVRFTVGGNGGGGGGNGGGNNGGNGGGNNGGNGGNGQNGNGQNGNGQNGNGQNGGGGGGRGNQGK